MLDSIVDSPVFRAIRHDRVQIAVIGQSSCERRHPSRADGEEESKVMNGTNYIKYRKSNRTNGS